MYGGEGECENKANAKVTNLGDQTMMILSTEKKKKFGRRKGLGGKKMNSVLDMVSFRCLWEFEISNRHLMVWY